MKTTTPGTGAPPSDSASDRAHPDLPRVAAPAAPPAPNGSAHPAAPARRPAAQDGGSELESRKVAEGARETQWTAPSFMKELFLGSFRFDLIHPNPATILCL